MKMPRLTRRQRMFVECAPFNDERIHDRAMRSAVFRVRKTEEFNNQLSFDRAVGGLAKKTPIPHEVEEWLAKQTLITPRKRPLRTVVQNPVFVAAGTAIAVIAGIFVLKLVERMNAFPGETTARRLLSVASSAKPIMLDPVKTDAGALSDLFYMKHRLSHYDVPPEFADFRTLGCRVFDDEEGQRVAQIWLTEKRMQLFLFPAERDLKTGAVQHFSDWRYVHHERWTGVVREKNGVCFMAALRGGEKDLAPYIAKPKE